MKLNTQKIRVKLKLVEGFGQTNVGVRVNVIPGWFAASYNIITSGTM